MATTLTQNLKLRVSSDLTVDSKFNLNRIDTLASIYQTDTNDTAKVRSKTNILLQPNDPDIGGSGTGGTVQVGTSDQPLSEFIINADAFNISGSLSLSDSATGGTYNLQLGYKSDIDGSVDTGENRTLDIDVNGANRQLVLGSNVSIIGENLTLTLPLATDWTLPPTTGTSGQVLTTDGFGTLSWTSATASSLDGLSDVTISSPIVNQALVYNGSSWENAAPTVGAETAFLWEPSDGSVKTIVHNLGSQQVLATVIDTTDDYKTVEVPDTTRPDGNTITLTATSAPSGGNWLVLLKQIIT